LDDQRKEALPKETRMERSTFTLTLPSDLRMLSVARSFIEAVCLACGLDRAQRHAVVMATGEAVSNIVRHAHRDVPGAELYLRVERAEETLVLTFIDQGEPFDLDSVPHLPPGELRIGGRGVYLLRALMDEVTCQSRGPGVRGNVLRLVKRLTPIAVARDCG
jgi:serine/threonine-protein kinase RsbW